MACVDACIVAVRMAPGLGPLSNHELIPLRGRGGSASTDELGRVSLRGPRSIYMLPKKKNQRRTPMWERKLRGAASGNRPEDSWTDEAGTSGDASDGNGATRWVGNYSSKLASCSMRGAEGHFGGPPAFQAPFESLGPIVNNLQEVVTKLLATVRDAFALNWQHCGPQFWASVASFATKRRLPRTRIIISGVFCNSLYADWGRVGARRD